MDRFDVDDVSLTYELQRRHRAGPARACQRLRVLVPATPRTVARHCDVVVSAPPPAVRRRPIPSADRRRGRRRLRTLDGSRRLADRPRRRPLLRRSRRSPTGHRRTRAGPFGGAARARRTWNLQLGTDRCRPAARHRRLHGRRQVGRRRQVPEPRVRRRLPGRAGQRGPGGLRRGRRRGRPVLPSGDGGGATVELRARRRQADHPTGAQRPRREQRPSASCKEANWCSRGSPKPSA